MPDDRVVVVGAGLVGLACAYSLAKRGHETIVVDAREPGSGASWGNAGWIAFAPGVVAPVPGPGVIGMSLRWMVQRDSPFRLIPRLELDYIRWLARFVASCSGRAAATGLEATIALNAETAVLFDALEHESVGFEMQRSGVLLVYRSERTFAEARKKLVSYPGGGNAEVLTREDAMSLEPLLRAEACAGAIRHETDRHLRPDQLVAALLDLARRFGVEIRAGCPCLDVVRRGERVLGIQTPDGTLRGRAYVLAAGTGMRKLGRRAGLRIPVEGGRGYSFDVPRDELPARLPVYIHDGRLALSPFGDFTRVVGMMELGARSATVRRRAIETMSRVGRTSFENWPAREPNNPWAGLRPMTPDGLPVIGPVEGIDNLYLAGGHGMLGVTLSLRTGEAIAACIDDSARLDPALNAFAPDRFRRRRRAAGTK